MAALALTVSAQALPITSFTPNASGGYDAVVYPVLLNGQPSLQSAIFTTPQAVNPGYVVILDSFSSKFTNTSSWDFVIDFFNNGSGVVDSLQMLVGGPNQATYFPSLSTVLQSPHVFIVKAGAGPGGDRAPTDLNFTSYSVKAGKKKRNYQFYTGPLVFRTPDKGSTLFLLSISLMTLIILRDKLRRN